MNTWTRSSGEGVASQSSESVTAGAHRGSLAADVIAAFTLTISSVGFAISFAALTFSGPIESGLSRAVGSFLVGGGVMAVLVARRSGIVPVATFMQDGPAIVMAVVVADFVAREGAEVSDVFVVLVVTMLATSLITGLLGHFGIGSLGRYAPTPVMVAFVGGTGWLLFKGGFDVMTSSSLGLADLAVLSRFEMAQFWAPGLLVGLISWLACRSQRLPGYALGIIFIGCIVVFYGVVSFRSSVPAVESAGWLLGPFPEAAGPLLVSPAEFRSANWAGIARSGPGIASVVGIACITQVLHLTGIRTELAPRLDIDAELRTGANANLSAALFGVIPGFQGYGYTMLLHRLGATRRAVPVIAGGSAVAFGVVGVRAVGYVPRLAIGALLVMIGVALVDDCVRGLRRLTSVAEQLLCVATVAAIVWFGLVEGVGLGFAAAGIVFIVRCSRVDSVRVTRDGRQLRSRADRTPAEAEHLVANGHRLAVVQLYGPLFFGSCDTLEDDVCQLALGPEPVDALVLDFATVTDVDSSAIAALVRLFQELRRGRVVAWVSALDPEVATSLLAIEPALAAYVRFEPVLEAALRQAEDQLLASLPKQLFPMAATGSQLFELPPLVSISPPTASPAMKMPNKLVATSRFVEVGPPPAVSVR